MSEVERGLFMGHVACPIHGGSDSLALYDKGDKIDGYCWSQCGGFSTKRLIDLEILDESGKKVIVDFATNGSKGVFVMTDEIMKEVNDILSKPILGWRERNIPKLVSEFYDVRTVSEDGKVKYRYYPSTIENGKLVGWHVRNDFVKQARNRGEKPAQAPFFPIGKVRSDCELFGQSKFNKGGKYLVLASGEEDAQVIFTALNVERSGSGLELKKFITPVISTTVGEGAVAQIKENYDFITSFENVIIMYDNDDAGREGAEKVAKVLKPGQAFISSYRRKDACDHASRSEFSEIVDSFWKAAKGEPYSPAGIVGSSQSFEALLERAKFEKIPMPSFASDLGEMLNGGIALGEITTIAAASSVGKGQPVWENVLTPDGYVKVSDVKVGDSLIGRSGEPVKVVGVYPQGVKKIFKVTLKDGSFAHCDESHLWSWSSTTRGKINTSDIMNLIERVESGKKVFLPKVSPVNFNEKDLPLDPWLLGILIGDGSLTENVGISSAEGDILKKVEDKISEYGLLLNKRGTDPDTICYDITKGFRGGSNKIRSILREMGMCLKSHEKFIPEIYKHGSPEQRLGLLQGLFDADGHVTKGRANLEYSTTSSVLADDVKFLARSLGCSARIVKRESFYKKNGVRVKCKDSYRVFIKQPENLFVFSSEKHQDKFKQGRAIARDLIESIDYIGDDESVCFKVDSEDQLYVTNDFIVTHNTTIVNEFLYHWVFNAPYTVGVISLESDLGELTENLMGLQLGVKLANIPDEDKLKLYSSLDFKHAYNRLVCKDTGEDRYYILDHQGAVTDGSLFNKIEYMVKVLGCKIIVLDPLTLALSGEGNDGMDKFMSNLLRFVKREKIAHVNVVHVRKSQGGAKANSRGAEISEEDMKGSGSVFQVSMNNILLMRDKVHEDKRVRNTTKVIVSKNRRCGRTGPAGFWFYEEKSGRLLKGIDPAQFGDSELGFVSFEEELSEFEGIGVFDQDSDQSVKKDFVLPTVNEPKGDASVTDDWEVNENASD